MITKKDLLKALEAVPEPTGMVNKEIYTSIGKVFNFLPDDCEENTVPEWEERYIQCFRDYYGVDEYLTCGLCAVLKDFIKEEFKKLKEEIEPKQSLDVLTRSDYHELVQVIYKSFEKRNIK